MVESISELRTKCQRSGPEPPSYRLIRKVSIYITWLLLHTPITANGATFLFLLFGVVGALFLAMGSHWSAIVGVFLLQIHILLDFVDGEIARYRKTSSWFGSYLEQLSHNIVYALVYGCMSWGIYKQLHVSPIVFIFGFLAAVAIILFNTDLSTEFWAVVRYYNITTENAATLQSYREKYLGTQKGEIRHKLLSTAMALLLGVGFFFIVLPFGAIINRMDLILYFYGVMRPIALLVVVMFTIKRRNISLRRLT